MEVVKNGKRIANLTVKYKPLSIAQSGKIVAVGGEVIIASALLFLGNADLVLGVVGREGVFV